MSAKLRSMLVLGVAAALVTGLVSVLQPAGALAANPPPSPTPLAPLANAPVSAPSAPTISSIDSPTPSCYQPVMYSNRCYISWQYMYVTADSGQYIISTTVSIDGRLRAYHAGFFQTYMYIPTDFNGPGFQVACGPAGASGLPTYGLSHSWVIQARQTGGSSTYNSGSVVCPPSLLKYNYLPFSRK
jgi:hypothetical protein